MEGYALVHIEAYAPMLESSCGGLHPDNGHKTSAQAYAPMLESSCGGLRPYNGKTTIGEFQSGTPSSAWRPTPRGWRAAPQLTQRSCCPG